MTTRGQLRPGIGREFLLAELNVGITFARMALSMHDGHAYKAERCARNARQAYETFLRFGHNVTLSDGDRAEVQQRADDLKRALVKLGEPLE